MTDLERASKKLLDAQLTLSDALMAMRALYITEALSRTEGNVTRAAQLLGVHRNTIINWLRLFREAG